MDIYTNMDVMDAFGDYILVGSGGMLLNNEMNKWHAFRHDTAHGWSFIHGMYTAKLLI